jgi:hypothetical protein
MYMYGGVFLWMALCEHFFYAQMCVILCGFLGWKHKRLEDGKDKHMSVIGLIKVKWIALHFHIIVWTWHFTKLDVASPQ